MPDWPLGYNETRTPYHLAAGLSHQIPNNLEELYVGQIDSDEPTAAFLDVQGYLQDGGSNSAFPTATVTVAAYNATPAIIAAANFACTGASDDTIINDAINSLPASGGLVILSEGTFNVDSTIYFQKDNSALLGMSEGTTIISVQSSFTGTEVISCQRNDLTPAANLRPCGFITVGNFTLNGNQVGIQSTVDGILFKAFNSTLRNVNVLHMNGCGVKMRGVTAAETGTSQWSCYGTWISDCYIHENGNGGIWFDAASADAFGVRGSTISENAGPGIRMSEIINTISHNFIWGNRDQSAAGGSLQGAGIMCLTGSGRTGIIGNKIEQNRSGINFTGGTSFQIVGNNLASNSTTISTFSTNPAMPAGWWTAGLFHVRSDVEFNGSGGSPSNVIFVCNSFDGTVYSGDVSLWNVSITSGSGLVFRFNNFTAGSSGVFNNSVGGGNVLSEGQNIGFVTEASGTATIASGSTNVTVTHGLSATPLAQDIKLILTNNPTVNPGVIWVDTIGSTTFRINCSVNPSTSGASFGWSVSTHRFN